MSCYQKHRERQLAYAKQWQAANVAKGLCPCGGTPRPNRVRCEKCAEARRQEYQRTKDTVVLARAKEHWRRNKGLVLQHYGGACACKGCGISDVRCLVLDHINGKGTQHRISLGNRGRGSTFYSWLIKNNYPEGLQVLCANCNMAKGAGPMCPIHNESPF